MPSGKSYDLREKAKDAASPYSDKAKSPSKSAAAPTSPSKTGHHAPTSPSKATHASGSGAKPTTTAARAVSPTGKPTMAAAGGSPSRIPTAGGVAPGVHHMAPASPTKQPTSPAKHLRDQVNKEVAKLGGSIQSKVLPNHGVVPKVTTKLVVQSQTPSRSPTAGSPTKPVAHAGAATTGRPGSPSKTSASASGASTATAAAPAAKLGVHQQATVGKTPQKATLTPEQIKKGLTHAGATSSPKSHSK